MKQTEASPMGCLYTSIHKLNMARFQDCLCDGNLQALIISGTPTDEDIADAWQIITQEYTEAMAGPEQLVYIRKLGTVNKLQMQIEQVLMLTDVLHRMYVARFADHLKRLIHENLPFDITNREQYNRSLKRSRAKVKEWQIQLQVKAGELNAMAQDQPSTAENPTREQFQKTLLTLSDHAGRELDENVLTVWQFCERLKRFNQYAKSNQAQKKSVTYGKQ